MKNIFKRFKIKEIIPNSKLVWYVEDSLIDILELENKREWIGTTIIWEITEKNSNAELLLTHLGLHPDIECYQICTNGWKEFTASLKAHLETGKGTPFLNNRS